MQGCVQRVFFGDVNAATVRVLAAEGCEVHAPRLPRCCGSLMMHAGLEEEALVLARETIAAYEAFDAIAVNVAGCGSGMKDYAHLLADDPEWAERAEAFSAKVRDVSELLAGEEPRVVRHPLPIKVAYHDACHLAHVCDQGRFLAFSRWSSRPMSTTMRSWVPLPISSISSRALTLNSMCRPSTLVTSATAVTRWPTGVAARWRILTPVPTALSPLSR